VLKYRGPLSHFRHWHYSASSLVSSILFLVYMNRRIKISISPVIAKTKSIEGSWIYSFKVINRTRTPLMNVAFRARLLSNKHATPRGIVYTLTDLSLAVPEVMEIEAFDPKDASAKYAVVVHILEDMDARIESERASAAEISVYASDSFTGYRKPFKRGLGPRTGILKEGHFELGNSLKIGRQ
jgi:hypothetical protein